MSEPTDIKTPALKATGAIAELSAWVGFFKGELDLVLGRMKELESVDYSPAKLPPELRTERLRELNALRQYVLNLHAAVSTRRDLLQSGDRRPGHRPATVSQLPQHLVPR